LISAPLGDDNFGWRSVDRMVGNARPAYQEQGAADRLIVLHPDCGHDFPDDVLEQSIDFLADRLGLRR
jgi:hypothetical protein